MGRMAEDAEAVNHDARRDDLSAVPAHGPVQRHDRPISGIRGRACSCFRPLPTTRLGT